MKSTDVLIVGAGPTGLMLANQLARFEINFILIDSKKSPTTESRALAVTARSMELYQQLGLSEQILTDAVTIEGLEIIRHGKSKSGINFGAFGKGLSDFPNILYAYEQSKNETMLAENLTKQGLSIEWNHELLELEQNESSVKCRIRNLESNTEQEIEANYLVGCDGASSVTRHLLDEPFKGGTYENRFFVLDTKITWNQPKDRIILCPTHNLFVAFFPLKGKDKIRVIGSIPQKLENEQTLKVHELEKHLKDETKLDFEFYDYGWHSIYKLHHRAAKDFKTKRIFLAGDAAHIHSPAGGQGMNAGLQDTHNLGWKLAMVLKSQAKEELLNTYNDERKPIANMIINSTDTAFSLMAGRKRWQRILRNYVLIPILSLAFKQKWMQLFAYKRISQLNHNYESTGISIKSDNPFKFKAGQRLPYFEQNYLENFKEATFYLLHIGKQQLKDPEKEKIIKDLPFETRFLEFELGENWQDLGVNTEGFILVRPDHYILWTNRSWEGKKLSAHLQSYFK